MSYRDIQLECSQCRSKGSDSVAMEQHHIRQFLLQDSFHTVQNIHCDVKQGFLSTIERRKKAFRFRM